ncbi:hypothetical protein TIFTF001_017512 [Ficus carica]|uniref:SWIM-type domain-containing protein n=1 Tax=Ficus carica TaxID=3494 RepID=A0AA88DAT9_FICCA|nr:hypothetical protein TIFTF001_017512 [Ficus carica]
MSKGFVVDRSINFLELEETIYDRTSIDRTIYVRGDDDLNSDGGDALDFQDNYFRCRINEEILFVARFIPTELLGSYEHPLQICATSTPINERITGFNPTLITGSNPTPEETVHEKVANEDDGVDKAGDDVPEGGNEVHKRRDGVPKEDDGVPEGGDGLHERVYDSRCQHYESEETRFVPLISSNSARNDGSDLMVGKYFDSKEELNTMLNLIAINGKFEMKVKKSTKSLKEVVCVDEPNCLWRVRATKMPVTTPVTPKREAILRRRFDETGLLTPYQLNENEYIVMGGDFNACVNLTTRSCTCRVFDIDKIPCIHAIVARGLYRPQHTGAYVYFFCSEYYILDYWMLAYAETIYPVPPEL